MIKRIMYIHPVRVTDPLFRDELLSFLRAEMDPDVEVEVTSLSRGPLHLRYRYYEALVLPDVLNRLKAAEDRGFHASIIGCFFDVGLQEARELLHRLAVVGPCQASVQIASTLCRRFSIIVGSGKGIPRIEENLRAYGAHHLLASFRAVDLPVLELHQNRADAVRRLREAGRAAVAQDGAEALILGCTATFGYWRELQAELGVPVIDPIIASFKWAELAAGLSERYQWLPGRIGAYEPPPESEMGAWGLLPADDLEP